MIVNRFRETRNMTVKAVFLIQVTRHVADGKIRAQHKNRGVLSSRLGKREINKKVRVDLLEIRNDAVLQCVVCLRVTCDIEGSYGDAGSIVPCHGAATEIEPDALLGDICDVDR